MKVLKFGGTSVGSVKSILSLKKIVENEAKSEDIIVVVSALGGITDKLKKDWGLNDVWNNIVYPRFAYLLRVFCNLMCPHLNYFN